MAEHLEHREDASASEDEHGPMPVLTRDSQNPRLQRERTYSLAGQVEPAAYCYRTDSYITPEYRDYHERYEQARPPVWGLAGPLPHTLRSGMRARRPSDAQTLPDDRQPEIRRGNSNLIRNTQSNVTRRPSIGPSLRRLSTGQRPRRLTTTRYQPAEPFPTYEESEEDSTSESDAQPQQQGDEGSKLTRVDLLKTAAANARQQHEDQSHQCKDVNLSEQTTSLAQDVESHDFAIGPPQQAGRPNSQEVCRPSQIDKPEIDLLRRQLQSQPGFVPHRSRSIARAPTEYDWEASHIRRTVSHGSLRRRRRASSSSSSNTSSRHSQTSQTQPNKFFNRWARYRHILREPLSEFLAVFVMMVTGFCGNLMYQINRVADPTQTRYGDFMSVQLTWAWGVMGAVYVAGGVSGAHLSPIVTIILCLFRGFPWRKVWVYALAQFLGTFVAALVVYGLYRDAMALTATQANVDLYDALIARSSVFQSAPTPGIGSATIFCTQAFMVALFFLVVFALGDDNNAPPGAGMNALIIGLFVFVIGCAFPYNTGASFNPFRDVAPRLVVSIIWRRADVWTERAAYWFWGCWIAPALGALLGALTYDVCIFTGGESPVNYPDLGEDAARTLRKGGKALRRVVVVRRRREAEGDAEGCPDRTARVSFDVKRADRDSDSSD
jgi:MIP family channel proteins